MKNLFVLMFIVLTVLLSAQAQSDKNEVSSITSEEKLFIGEDLTYVVKYAFFNLGEVRLKVLEKTTINNTPVYKRGNEEGKPLIDTIKISESGLTAPVLSFAYTITP